jgi:hypothetical protein
MTTSRLGVMDRRMAIGGGLAATAGLAVPRRQTRVLTQRGMVGGGLVQFEQGEANFSVLASRLIFAEDEVVVLGTVLWVDATVGLTLRSTAITDYIVPEVQPEQGQSRLIQGRMSVNDEGEYPFALELIDADLPGTGVDMALLTVGEDARTGENATPVSGGGFSYVANGTLVTGDLQLIGIEVDPENLVARPAPN